MSICAYYDKETKNCALKSCSQGNRDNKGDCTSKGEIYDTFKEKKVSNYEYQNNYKPL